MAGLHAEDSAHAGAGGFASARGRTMSPEHLRQLMVVTWVGVGWNVILFGLKLAAGLAGGSQAVVTDSVHSLADAATGVALLVGARYWTAPADESHPHGHRRIETLVTVSISIALAAAAASLAYGALQSLSEEHVAPPGWIAFWAALIAIVSKEALYRWTWAVGKRIKSSAVLASAWDHRSDAFSPIPAALAVAGARIHPSWAFLDRVGAVVVALVILQAVWKIGWPAVRELMDTSAPREILRRIEEIALQTTGVKAAHSIRTRYVGSGVAVDLHVTVDGAMSVLDGHNVSEAVESRLLSEGPDVVDVVVHLEPQDASADDGR